MASVVFASIVLALTALIIFLTMRLNRSSERSRRPAVVPVPVAGSDKASSLDTSANAAANPTVLFLVALGEAMIDSSAVVTQVSETLDLVAEANGVHGAEMIVLPTSLMVSISDGATVRTAVASAGQAPLRLEQVDAVFSVVAEAEQGTLTPSQGLARLAQVRAMAPGFGPLARVLGYIVMTAGLALVLQAGWTELLVASVLGAAVGVVQLASTRFEPVYRVFVPVSCAFGVSVAVLLLARTGLDVGVFAPIVAPLVTFLPGALLTTSVIELATGQMISGAGRIAAGGMQLVLLALGIVAGAQLVGVPSTDLLAHASRPLGPLAPWLGVALFGAGVVVHRCARRSTLGWIILVLYVAYAGQVVGGFLFGDFLSGFFGALAMTPVALFVASRPSGPNALVSFLPGFWLLVPGALGLVGVTQVLGYAGREGAASLVTTGVTMVGIALGVLLGLAVAAGGSALIRRIRTRSPDPA